jgi:hypothetical protein
MAYHGRSTMRYRPKSRTQRELITALLLVALTFRALIPMGFMPAADGAFSLQICRAGFLASIDPPDQHAPPGQPSHFEHCPFGSAPATGPIANVPALQAAGPLAFPPAGDFITLRLGARLERAHQPRAPPSRLS